MEEATKRYIIVSGKHGRLVDGILVRKRPGDEIRLTAAQAREWPGKLRLLEDQADAIVGKQADNDDSVGLGSTAGRREREEKKLAEAEENEQRRARAKKAAGSTRRGGGAARS